MNISDICRACTVKRQGILVPFTITTYLLTAGKVRLRKKRYGKKGIRTSYAQIRVMALAGIYER